MEDHSTLELSSLGEEISDIEDIDSHEAEDMKRLADILFPVPPSSEDGPETPAVSTPRMTYSPLDDSVDSIRLLSIHPKLDWDDTIRCDLIHSTFREKPVYSALSYAWGNADETHTIQINGASFLIRQHLFEALQNFRTRDTFEIGKLYWIDAICINQEDPDERSKQVALMDYIYTRASCVLIWLGFPEPGHHEWSQRTNPDKWEALRDMPDWLLSNSYWTRLWIIQEIGLATNLIVCTSRDRYGWSEFCQFVSTESFPQLLFPLGYGRLKLIQNLDQQRRARHKQSNRLEVLLERFQHAQCQEPRDKIFAFFGLAHDCHDGTLQANYVKAMSEIHADCIKHFCRRRFFPDGVANDIDRQTRLVRYSQFLWRLIGRNSLATLEHPIISSDQVQVRGSLCGEVLEVGPTYDEMISSASANRKWKAIFELHYKLPQDSEKVREANESYNNVLLGMDDADLAKIRVVDQQDCYVRGVPVDEYGVQDNWAYAGSRDRPRRSTLPEEPRASTSLISTPQPRIFLGSNFFLGVAPAEVKKGDRICQFANTDIGVLIREEAVSEDFRFRNDDGDASGFRLIGRLHLNVDCKDLQPIREDEAEQVTVPYGIEVIIRMDMKTFVSLTC